MQTRAAQCKPAHGDYVDHDGSLRPTAPDVFIGLNGAGRRIARKGKRCDIAFADGWRLTARGSSRSSSIDECEDSAVVRIGCSTRAIACGGATVVEAGGLLALDEFG